MRLLLIFLIVTTCFASPEATPPIEQSWSFNGPFGSYDRGALRRGLKVYKEVCATCHSLKHVRFGKLKEIGLTEAEVKAFASLYEVPDIPNDEGIVNPRKALPSDTFPSVYANEKAGRAANNGALPPDLSVITKARAGGADYVFSLLTGFQDPPPAGVILNPGQYYNPYMSGGAIAMIPPLKDGLVTYDDGTEATMSQMAHDVTTFLSWAAEPEMEDSKRMGLKVLLYLMVMTVLLYVSMRKVWAENHD